MTDHAGEEDITERLLSNSMASYAFSDDEGLILIHAAEAIATLRQERDRLKLALGPLIGSAFLAAILTEDPAIARVLQHDIDHAKEAMSNE